MSFETLIAQYGYIALFVGTFLEGETILVIAGLLASPAHAKLLNIWWVVAVAFAGSYAGDQCWFYIGRHRGQAFIAKRPWWQKQAVRVYRVLDRHATWVTLAFRFWYGLRNITPFAIGMSGMRPLRFGVLNGIGAIIWALTLGWAGYFIGERLKEWLKDVRDYQLLIIGGIVVLAFGIWFARWCVRPKLAKGKIEHESAPSPTDGPAESPKP